MESQKDKINRLIARASQVLTKDYVIVGKVRVRNWYAWLSLGLIAGIAIGIIIVANRSGEFESSTATSLTQLRELKDKYSQLPNEQNLNELKSLAQSRQKSLLTLIEENPDKFLKQVAFKNTRSEFPTEVWPYLEEEVDLKGSLEILHADDFENKIAKEHYFLKTADQKRFSLYFVEKGPLLMFGSKVRIRGVKLENKIVIPDPQKEHFEEIFESQF